jgi:hypothetical protein
MAREVKLPCQAVAVRYVHDVRTAEFLNIGVVLMSPGHQFAAARFLAQWTRVTSAFPDAEPVHLRRIARAIERACEMWTAQCVQLELSGGVQDVRMLLRDAIAFEDASIQFSEVIVGVTADPRVTLDDLFDLYAGRLAETSPRRSRADSDVWTSFTEHVSNRSVLVHLRPHTLKAPHYSLSFDYAWKNGTWNATQPISFDLLEPGTIRDKAATWAGRLSAVRPSAFDTHVFLLVGTPGEHSPSPIRQAAEDAIAILEEQLVGEAEVVREAEGEKIVTKLVYDVAHAKVTVSDS